MVTISIITTTVCIATTTMQVIAVTSEIVNNNSGLHIAALTKRFRLQGHFLRVVCWKYLSLWDKVGTLDAL